MTDFTQTQSEWDESLHNSAVWSFKKLWLHNEDLSQPSITVKNLSDSKNSTNTEDSESLSQSENSKNTEDSESLMLSVNSTDDDGWEVSLASEKSADFRASWI